MSSPARPPFTPIPVTDLQSAANAIADIYTKLSSLVQVVNQPAPPAPAPTAETPTPGLRVLKSTAELLASDAGNTVSFLIHTLQDLILPLSRTMPQGEYTIQNQAGSTVVLTLRSPSGEKINNVAANTIAAGHSWKIQPTGTGWIITAKL